MVKKRTKKKTLKNKEIKRIGVYISLYADIEGERKKLDKYIVEQGCQRLSSINTKEDKEKKILELYTRVRYVGKRKAKKLKPITADVIEEELNRMAKELIFSGKITNI